MDSHYRPASIRLLPWLPCPERSLPPRLSDVNIQRRFSGHELRRLDGPGRVRGRRTWNTLTSPLKRSMERGAVQVFVVVSGRQLTRLRIPASRPNQPAAVAEAHQNHEASKICSTPQDATGKVCRRWQREVRK
ncbi:hypothetical protein O3P69_008240 [Scylla paramamosain]|uniref:Uncharacterized protein n=1 Tax=Scylla paramamosain TaxID=85552 RepID=A0AAW0T1X1_SCYPA